MDLSLEGDLRKDWRALLSGNLGIFVRHGALDAVIVQVVPDDEGNAMTEVMIVFQSGFAHSFSMALEPDMGPEQVSNLVRDFLNGLGIITGTE